MKPLLQLAHAIDRLNQAIGRAASWLVLAMVLISAGNAIVRKLFSTSSNSFLEIQWYLFAAVFLLTAAHTLLKDEHVRIDVLSSRLNPRAHAWIDILGGLLFLLPLTGVVLYYAWPYFWQAFTSQEQSGDSGGLVRWPVLFLIPAGFALLALQGISEIIKKIGFLLNIEPMEQPCAHPSEKSMLHKANTEQEP